MAKIDNILLNVIAYHCIRYNNKKLQLFIEQSSNEYAAIVYMYDVTKVSYVSDVK